MLQIDLSSLFVPASKTKCAEVFWESEANFSIFCALCALKSFDFTDFCLHYKNAHLVEFEETLPKMMEHLDTIATAEYIAIESKTEADQAASDDPPMELHVDQAKEETDPLSSSTDESMDGETRDEAKDEVILKNTKSILFNCDKCSKKFKSAKYLQVHNKKQHTRKTIDLPCSYCGKGFRSTTALEAHTKKEHTGYPCPDCDKVYKSRVVLHEHRYKHTKTRQFPCTEIGCSSAFRSPKKLRIHRDLVHIAFLKFVCETCGKRFKKNSSLTIHMRSHTGERPFKCKVCNKGFGSQALVTEHMPIHSSERPHKCEVCGAAFSRPKALYHHKHLHLDVKKYKCKICGKSYAQAAGLCGHMRQHKSSVTLSALSKDKLADCRQSFIGEHKIYDIRDCDVNAVRPLALADY